MESTSEFKFNFLSGDSSSASESPTSTTATPASAAAAETLHLCCAEVVVPDATESVPGLPGILKCSPSAVACPFPADCDVIPGVYEGGYKTWECSVDLAQYILEAETSCIVTEAATASLRVLELGCGSGLPSIAVKRRFPHAHLALQDYNASVLRSITAPNLLLNGISLGCDKGCERSCDRGCAIGCNCDYKCKCKCDCTTTNNNNNNNNCSFYSGDWNGLTALLPANHFDLILTSETIYRVTAYPSLLAVFRHALAPGGRVLVAAKDYYFGLGGSVEEFARAVVAADAEFQIRKVWHYSDGVPRTILEIQRQSDCCGV